MRKTLVVYAVLAIMVLGTACEVNSAPIDGSDIKYTLTLTSGEGGSIPAGLAETTSGEYQSDKRISIIARQLPGYVFVEWQSSNGGKFDDKKSNVTYFTMPENDVTVTAIFRIED